jgi:isoleucyl-tRNA synthetase
LEITHLRPTVEIKNTLNLSKTSFSMKANLPQREPTMLKHWEEIDVYGKIRSARAGCPPWVLHDGPPYANGAIHMGTAINKILKDIIVKSRSMMGMTPLTCPVGTVTAFRLKSRLIRFWAPKRLR